ncbi:IclR family transcriptional regulator [Glutamicibacter sp. AOP5-A2-18]|uniref:IclR family transcriptional regulator n=1 Tax=Glutamicibacter sp. AOP5-A2-18 TaxID=3457656 RepID=UPI004034F224
MIQSIDRAAKILGLLQGARRLGISELASALELPPSTVHGIVKSLQAHGLVAQEVTGNRYVLGPALLKLSSVYLDTLDVRSRAMRWMHELSRTTGFSTRLGVNLLGEVLIIHHERRPDDTEQMPETGLNLPAHASALGKVLLAYIPEMKLEVLSRTLGELTGYTITEPGVLNTELEQVRTNAVALENEEAVIGESSVAVPVFGEGSVITAALSLVIPDSQWPVDEKNVRDLHDAAWAISKELGASVRPPRAG